MSHCLIIRVLTDTGRDLISLIQLYVIMCLPKSLQTEPITHGRKACCSRIVWDCVVKCSKPSGLSWGVNRMRFVMRALLGSKKPPHPSCVARLSSYLPSPAPKRCPDCVVVTLMLRAFMSLERNLVKVPKPVVLFRCKVELFMLVIDSLIPGPEREGSRGGSDICQTAALQKL